MYNIPEKIYVARQLRTEDEVLGFMVIADKEHTKAFKTSKYKADNWAKGYKGWGYQEIESIYIDNTPKTGFKLVTNVSRYSTSNVVWRIMYPTGEFEFEITSDNLCDLCATNTLINGEFQEELFFTNGRKLVSTKTQLFADMIQKVESKKEKIVKSNELKIGETIIISVPNYISPNDRSRDHQYSLVYCGKYHACTCQKNRPMQVTTKSSNKFVLLDQSTGLYRTFNELQDFVVTDDELVDIDTTNIISILNEQIKNNNLTLLKYYKDGYIPSETLPVYFHNKSFNYSDLKIIFENVDSSDIDAISSNKIYKFNEYRIFGFYFVMDGRNYSHYSDERSTYENDGNKTIKTHGIVGDRIISYQDNGYPNVETDIFPYKEIFGFNGPYHRNGELIKHKMPKTIEVGYYTMGE